jgi:hypothetical protein
MTARGAAQLAADEIIRKSVGANERDFQMGPSFSHLERDVDQKGDEKTDRSFEVSLMDGSPYRRLVAVDGNPIPLGQQHQEELKEKHELARRRSEAPPEREVRLHKYQADREHDHVLMTQMAVAFTFHLLGHENLNGHETYVLDAEPRPDYHPVNRDARVLTGMHGKMWVDAEHFHWAKVDAEVVRPVTFGGFLARVGPGTRFVLSKEPVGDDVWQPMDFTMQVVSTVLFFPHNSISTQHYSNYREGGIAAVPKPAGAALAGSLPDPFSAIENRADLSTPQSPADDRDLPPSAGSIPSGSFSKAQPPRPSPA